MDPTTLDNLRRRLTEERAELVVQLEDLGINAETGAPREANFEHGFADSGQATAEKARLLSVAEALLETLRDVDAAFGRIEEGRYGLCESCGEEIPLERLEARPQAGLCFRCKQRATG